MASSYSGNMPAVPSEPGHDARAAEYFGGGEEKKKKSGHGGAIAGAAAGLALGGIGGAILAHELSKLLESCRSIAVAAVCVQETRRLVDRILMSG